MLTIDYLVHWVLSLLHKAVPQNPREQKKTTACQPSSHSLSQPEHKLIVQDDSPSGSKIRWHC